MSFLRATAACTKAIFIPLPCSSAFVNASARRLGPQMHFPIPQKTKNAISCNSPLTALNRHNTSVKPLYFPFTHSLAHSRHQLAMRAISHAKPPTHHLISIEVNLSLVRLLETHHCCSTPLLSITPHAEIAKSGTFKGGTARH